LLAVRGSIDDRVITAWKGRPMLWFAIACQDGPFCTDRRVPPRRPEPYMNRKRRRRSVESAPRRIAPTCWLGGRVEVRGFLRSACVIFTNLANACVGTRRDDRLSWIECEQGAHRNQQMARYLRGCGKEPQISGGMQFIPPTEKSTRSQPARYAALDPPRIQAFDN